MTAKRTEKAIVAGGCFWGIQYYFDQIAGVLETRVGYSGGTVEKPTYEQVCYEHTGHAEVTEIIFDPETISYEEVLMHFFAIHNPTTMNRQGPDIGEQYRSVIFFTSPEQKATAEKVIKKLEAMKHFDKPIVTQLVPEAPFWQAEDYHQKFTERTGRGACHFIDESLLKSQ